MASKLLTVAITYDLEDWYVPHEYKQGTTKHKELMSWLDRRKDAKARIIILKSDMTEGGRWIHSPSVKD